VLRYFYVRFTGQLRLQTESRARLQALQARIRPHFLFNSLNTIASLTYDQPARAEQAIENLADLFRASLNAEASISLQQEIELTQNYIELEQLRLDQRLKVSWDIEADTDRIQLPALTLQPLVENAIYHGIEPLAKGGEVIISIKQGEQLVIGITNPLNKSANSQHRKGNQMALENIHERLNLAFHGQAKIQHVAENDLYKVEIRIPLN
jgi:two-component system sensor histidine kinase AlgZ